MRNFRTLVCPFRTLELGVRKWHPFCWWFRTLKGGVRNFRTLFRTVRKSAWGVRNWHTCARRGFRTVRKFSHLPQWCAKLDFRKFAPWKGISHLEIDFAPWGRVCENGFFWPKDFAPWFWGVRNFRTLKSGALLPWFYSPVLLLKSSPHLSWFFSEIYHENWLELRQNKLRLKKNYNIKK